MTENENIKKIINENTQIAIGNLTAIKLICKKFENAEETIDMAIQALEENQQYRELGTVEHIKLTFELCKGLDAMVKMYQAIGTVDEFKALKEKSVAKKPDYEGDGYYNGQIVLDTWICPNCGKHYEVDYDDYEHCPNCGQHIDHSELTEED